MSADESVITRLDTLIRLVAAMATKDKPQVEQITMLSKAGLQPKDIAGLVGTTPNAVSARLSEIKKQEKLKPKKHTKEGK